MKKNERIPLKDWFIKEPESEDGAIHIQLIIKDPKDRDKVANLLAKKLHSKDDFIPGATISQIYFDGNGIEELVRQFKEKAKELIDTLTFN